MLMVAVLSIQFMYEETELQINRCVKRKSSIRYLYSYPCSNRIIVRYENKNICNERKMNFRKQTNEFPFGSTEHTIFKCSLCVYFLYSTYFHCCLTRKNFFSFFFCFPTIKTKFRNVIDGKVNHTYCSFKLE